MKSAWLGRGYEREAERFLRANGLQVIERNYRCKRGEIDLVMQDNETVVFVEVRYRRSNAYGTPAETVTPRKRERLLRAARHYLASNPVFSDRVCRFDVVGISGKGRAAELSWIKNAFSA